MSVTSTCYDLFEQTSSFARLNLSKFESSGLELSISNIRAGFTANKDSSVIFNSTRYLVDPNEYITGKGVSSIDDCDVALTDKERMINAKTVKKIKAIEKRL